MIEFKRDPWKKDEVIGKLYDAIIKNHKAADHTEKVLIKNKRIKDFCEEAEHFLVMGGGEGSDMYLSYICSSWFKEPMGIQVKVESIIVYENFIEYEGARMRGLNSTKDSTGLNLN